MDIRKATDKETEEILNYAETVLREATVGHVVPSKDKALHFVWPFLENGGYYLICIEENVQKGWIGVGMAYDIFAEQEVGVLFEIYVIPAYRNQGIAKNLTKAACKQLKKDGYKKIQLNVYSGNSIKSFCEKLGFKEVFTLMNLDL